MDKAFLGEGRGCVRPVGDGEPVVDRNHVENHRHGYTRLQLDPRLRSRSTTGT